MASANACVMDVHLPHLSSSASLAVCTLACQQSSVLVQERYGMIDSMVVVPRNSERDMMLKDLAKHPRQRRMHTHYLYQEELFSMRRKQFWPILMADNIMNVFIPERVSHEADGLILQPWIGPESQYIPNTCEEVLKWKYAHLNSVDFRLRTLQGATSAKGTLQWYA